MATFFHVLNDPLTATSISEEISLEGNGIKNIIEWAKTERGGRQFSIFNEIDDATMCNSAYGLCE